MAKHYDDATAWGWGLHSNYLHNIWTRYKINNQHINRMWAEQDGKCVCGREFAHPLRKELRTGFKPEIDHKHRFDPKGKELPCTADDVRGLLCSRCNALLGKIRENIDVLGGLLAYLRKNGEVE